MWLNQPVEIGMQRRHLNNLGFTAAEVLIAVTVFTIVLMGVAVMFASGTRDIHSGGNRSQAAYFVHQKLEELRNVPVFPPAPVNPAPPALDNPAPGFTRSWGVSALTGTIPSRLATVAVTVSWTDGTGLKSMQSVTYLPEP